MLARAPARMSAAAAAQVAVAIPALNEEQSIREVVRGIAAAGASCIIVADGGTEEGVVRANLDLESLRKYRTGLPFLNDL